MKKHKPILYFATLLMFSFLISCKDSEKETEEALDEDSIQTIVYGKALIDESDPALWIYDYNADIPLKNREVEEMHITHEEWIDFLNAQNENVYMEFFKHSGDTLFIKIVESTFLTQQMGTAGADAYLSVATYTLTESKNVNYVHFDFEEGDHAIPGTYSRQYYIDRNKERFH
jgi:hypothetical protein